jgi:type VI secretion system secreted protein Hcp
MAFDAFLAIPGVEGESTRDGHVGETEIFSFSWGVDNPSTIGSAAPGSGGGRATLSAFNFMKKSDKFTSAAFSQCCVGQAFDKATVTLQKASGGTGEGLKFIIYEFTKVYFTSIQWSGSSGGDDTPTEACSFTFAAVKMTYVPQDANGTPGDQLINNYDQTTGLSS